SFEQPDSGAQAAQDPALCRAQSARLAGSWQAGADVADAIRVSGRVHQGLFPETGAARWLARLRCRADRRGLCGLQAHALLRNAAQSGVARHGSESAARLWTGPVNPGNDQTLSTLRFGAIRTGHPASLAGCD